MLTHDAWHTTDDDGRQPIAIGHLSDSGDLKTESEWLERSANNANKFGV